MTPTQTQLLVDQFLADQEKADRRLHLARDPAPAPHRPGQIRLHRGGEVITRADLLAVAREWLGVNAGPLDPGAFTNAVVVRLAARREPDDPEPDEYPQGSRGRHRHTTRG